jgi:hypothetical protein
VRTLTSALVTSLVAAGLLVGGAPSQAAVAERPGPMRLSSTSVPEDAGVGTLVGRLSAGRTESTFRLVPGAGSRDNALVEIRERRLTVAGPLDFETATQLRIRVQATSPDGKHRVARFTVPVRDVVDQPPTDITLTGGSVAENLPAGTTVGTLGTVGADATGTYAVVGAPDFTVVGDQLRTTAPLDHEAAALRTVRVQATTGAGTVEKDLSVTVTDANDAPTDVQLSPASVPELSAPTLVGTLTGTDQDQPETLTYALVAGAGDRDNGLFSIAGAQLWTASQLDHEAGGAYSVRVRVTDAAGATFEKSLTVTATDVYEAPSVNQAPYDLHLTDDHVDENQPAGTVVGNAVATDPDGDALTYELVVPVRCRAAAHRGCRMSPLPDNPFVVSAAGEVTTAFAFDHEDTETWALRIRVTDSHGLSLEQDFTVTVDDVNEAPFDLALDVTSVPVSTPAGTIVGHASATDYDAGDQLTYTLVSGCPVRARCRTTTTVGAFSITSEGELSTATALDFGGYSVRIRVTDRAGLSQTETFAINVGCPERPAARC